MATLSLPWSFNPNTLADATKVQADFDAIRTHVNTELVNRDGSIAFTAVPTGPGSDPVSANQLARKQYVDNVAANAVLAGSIVYTCRAAAPTGWLFLDGSTVVNGQSLYPTLWTVIPAGWQSGSNIVLPNARGRFFIGLDPGTAAYDAVAETGGASTVALSTANVPAHTHSGVTGTENQQHNHNPGSGAQFGNFTAFGGAQNLGAGGNAFPTSNTTGVENQAHNHNFTTDNGTGSGSAFSILPPFMAFNAMIRAY